MSDVAGAGPQRLRVIFVTGDRDWSDEAALRAVLRSHKPGAWLLNGGCRGADLLAQSMAYEFGFQPVRMDAIWPYHGKKAGSVRNREMGKMLNILRKVGAAITCYACHNDLENSKGTKDMVEILVANDFKWALVTSEKSNV